MAFANFSFAAPAEPDPTYVPDFRVLRDVGDSILPLFGEDDGTIPDGTGQQLLEGCMERNWVLTDHLIRLLETAWRIKQAQDDVKKAVNTQDEKTGFTPAYLCVRENKPAFAEKLANLGADLNVRIRDGSTALHFAAANLKEDVVRLLITVGSDASLQGGPLNQLPLHVACARKHGAFPVVQYLVYLSGEYARLMMDAQGETALWRATEACHFHLVKELLKEQAAAQLSYQNKVQNGDTVMHSALRRGQTDFLKVFIDTGASVNIQNFDGQTLLHIAVQNVNKAAITLLHEHNANAELVDKYERTPLHLAVERGLDDVVNMLTELYSGSIHIRTKDGSTLAHIASLSGHPETVLTLLKRGVYLHMPNKTGALALHAAARTGHSSVVKALLMKGSKVDAKTRSNYTALHLAIEYAKSSVVEVLLGAGASVHTKGAR
ncbi:hypothetical protein RvY_09871-1 [Ramazzottius varieornatus]|uniref:Uncharacterized protein n=1 Tax=Ramazzottius varieornatus TaxID=947166 RepID=A0A1D1VCZ6_RAMVA|nr:hypothetical protein RvY_09871-1 [Ramazzottius varieornatus]